MKLHVAAAALVLITTPALAASDGCPTGSYLVARPDDTAVSVTFDELQVANVTGPATVVCDLFVSAKDPNDPPASGTFEAYSADYRGFVFPDQAASFTVTENGVVRSLEVVPSEEGVEGFLMHTYVGPDEFGTLNSNIAVDAIGVGAEPVAGIDTVDYLFLGSTTLGSQVASLDQLASQATAVVMHLNTTTGLVVSANKPLVRDDEVSLFGAVGSHNVGLTGHFDLDDGFSLDGGVALFDQSVDGAATSGVLLGGKAGFLQPEGGSAFRWLGSAGLTVAPGMSMSFSRDYTLFDINDVPSTVNGKADGNGTMVGVWLEGGLLVAPAPDNEIIFSASYARNWLNFGGVAEEQTDANPFAFSADGASTFDTLKAKAAWSTAITPDVDLTLHAAVGQVIASDFSGDVALVGPLTVGGQDDTFAEYGARVDWQVTETAQVGVFALGSTGSVTGTHLQVGAAAGMKF